MLRRWVARSLWWSAGARPEIVEVLSPQERLKYASIGIYVLANTLVSALAIAYLSRSAGVNLAVTLLSTVLWAALSIVINRNVLDTLRVRGTAGYSVQFLRIVPRLLLLIFMALVTAQPLELMLFAKAIDRTMQTQNATAIREIDEQISVLEADTNSLEKHLDSMAESVNAKLNSYLREIQGSEGSVPGLGPVTNVKRQIYEQANNELKQQQAQFYVQTRQNADRVAFLRSRRDQLLHDRTARPNTFISRLETLAELRKESSAVRRIYFLFLGFLILVEFTPILLKLLAPADFYEYAVEHSGNDLAIQRMRHLAERTEATTETMQRALADALDQSGLNPSRKEVRPRW